LPVCKHPHLKFCLRLLTSMKQNKLLEIKKIGGIK
jgi:hypothetical protein